MLKKFKKSIICILDINFTLIKKNNCFLKAVCYNDNRGEYMKTIKNEKGFSLVELLAVLVILALLAILAGGTVMNIIKKAEDGVTEAQEKAILNAAEKWSVDNSDKFDDVEGTSIQVGLDIVFVVDVSGSMNYKLECEDGDRDCEEYYSAESEYAKSRYYAAVDAINGALDVLGQNPKSRIAFVFYSTGAGDGSYGYVTALNSAGSIGKLQANFGRSNGSINIGGATVAVSGGTYTQGGFVKGANILVNANNKNNQIPVLIMLTDGEPTYGYGHDISGSSGGRPGGGGSSSTINTTPAYAENPTTYNNKNLGSGSAFSNSLGWHLVNNASMARDEIKNAYGVEPFIYTIALGLEEDYNQFVLDPSKEKYDNMKNGSTAGKSLYNALNSKMYVDGSYQTKYDYVTESFYGKMDASDLNRYFRNIANQVTEATVVTQVCVSVQELFDSGYLSKTDVKLSGGLNANEEYVIMSFNEATNQYVYSFAREDEQKAICTGS